MRRDEITPEVVRCLLREQMPQWCHLPITPVDLEGWDNRTYRLGEDMSVRLPTHEMYVDQVEKEHRWLPVLAPQLPLAIPEPLAIGRAGCGYPWPWSVRRWLPGQPIAADARPDRRALAVELARFLVALQSADAGDGPRAGRHSHGRGAPVGIWDAETRAAIARFGPPAARDVWEAALAVGFDGEPVWVHGDVSGSNLLALDGRLTAVIDFGCCAVGDPACDLVVAWTAFDGADREAFVAGLGLDEGTWARARGWALWKAIVTRSRSDGDDAAARAWARRFGWRFDPAQVVEEVVSDHTRMGG